MEPFTLVEESTRPGPHHLFDDVVEEGSAKFADPDLQYVTALREANPGFIVTGVPAFNVPLRAFAAAGFALCEVDKDTDSYWSWLGYTAPDLRSKKGQLAEQVHFAKYRYSWNNENFILYTVGGMQYIVKEKRDEEGVLGPSRTTDALLKTIGDWLISDEEVVWVFDGYWSRSKALYKEVQKASWDKVILDEEQKKDLTQVTNKFFESKAVYEDLGVPWKRGLLFHGPPGNGKTISIKALMHTLLDRKHPIPTLYVKSAPNSYSIRSVFVQARRLSPCMLVLEDIETIVTPQTRSYFFNEMDGLENNDGLFVVGSTNFLDRLDPGLSKRPSRFDRKYLFPLPNEHERTLYCLYWRHKLRNKPSIDFPKKLCPEMARVTPAFSFAFLQECFIATLLIMARHEVSSSEAVESDDGGDDLDDYELWLVFQQQADILRKEIQDSNKAKASPLLEWCRSSDSQAAAGAASKDMAGSADCTTCQHCQCLQKKGSANMQSRSVGSVAPFQDHRSEDELLYELPFQYQKQLVITRSAYESGGQDPGPWTAAEL